MTRNAVRLAVPGLLIAWLTAPAGSADWPTYRRDCQRSGASPEALRVPLSAEWTFTPTHPPEHAWGDPQPKPVEHVLELPRMRFDDAFHVAAVGEAVYFGSSADGQVYALDARTGEIRWRFHTDGPVRLAPTVEQGKLYVGSDDGRVYCLRASDGRELWRFSAAPAAHLLLGNGKMISLWPVRTGVVVDGGVAYFGAGVWPAEGLYLYAVDAETGKLRWRNDTYGRGGMSGITPQGYMVASSERLFVPSGRTLPAGFRRRDGQFLFHPSLSWRSVGLFSSTNAMLAGDLLLTGAEQILGIAERTGRLALTEGVPATVYSKGTRQVAVDGELIVFTTGEAVVAADRDAWLSLHRRLTAARGELRRLSRDRDRLTRQRQALRKAKKSDKEAAKKLLAVQKRISQTQARYKELKGQTDRPIRWRAPCKACDAIVRTRGKVFVGGDGVVTAFEGEGGKQVWSGKVNGRARGLAVANGRLLVSTDRGSIHCFVAGEAGRGRKTTPALAAEPFGKQVSMAPYERLADKLVRESGARRGYALLLGGDGRLAAALARKSELMVYVLEADAKKVSAAREALTAAGLYGRRVVVMRARPGPPPCADYFANLIVCRTGFFAGEMPFAAAELLRTLKPCGGVAYVALPRGGETAARKKADWAASLREAVARAGETDSKLTSQDGWTKLTRGALPGAGSWTHQYGEPGNTCCSDDRRVRGPLGVLWYGAPGPGQMPSRHASAASPVAVGGRLFAQGEEVLMAHDAYNGLQLWKRKIPGAMRLGLKQRVSNLAANANSLFVAVRDKCLRLAPATGRTLRTYQVPAGKDGKRGRWEYVACVGELLYGSREGKGLFAFEIDSGKLRWSHEGKQIQPATICLHGGRVFYVDRAVTDKQKQEALAGVSPSQRVDRRGRPVKPDVRLVVALDAETGKPQWTRPQYVADCVKIGRAGGDLITMAARDVLLLCGQPWNGHFWREFCAGEFSRRSLIALAADSGRPLWSGRKGYRSRPLIVGDWIVAEPWAHDLKTGRPKRRVHPVTGAEGSWQMARPGHHCGNIAAAPNALFFRSGVTAYYDLLGDYGTAHFGAQRPGCWVNCIPANGVVIMPEASSGCVCPFAIQCTVVFRPQKRSRMWGMFSAPGGLTPVKHLAVNFGALGDRRDGRGTLWLAYPRPRSYEHPADQRLVLNFALGVQVAKGGGYFRDNCDFLALEGKDDAWIYASGCRGPARCTVPLAEKGARPGRYTVRLHFARTGADDEPCRFDVRLQGRTVLRGFEPAKAAGGAGKAVVKEFADVRAAERLDVSFGLVRGQPALCGLEVIAR